MSLSFDTDVKAREVYDKLRELVLMAKPLPSDYISVHKCHHDDDVHEDCEVIKTWRPKP